MDSRNTSEEDLVVIVVEHDITSHKEGDTTIILLFSLKMALGPKIRKNKDLYCSGEVECMMKGREKDMD